jgi:hypothetical protein
MRHPLSATTALATLLLVAGFPTLLPASAARATDPEALLRGGRVVLVPPNLGVRAAAEVEPGVDPVWRQILAHFAEQPTRATALERSSAGALWNEVMREVQAQPGAGVYDAYALFARRIADQVDYSAIVFPSLVTRAARVNGGSAAWDGVRRTIDGPLARETVGAVAGSDILVYRDGVRGDLAAASLHVAVLSPDGELRFEGAGGLALLQELASNDAADVGVAMRSDAFDDAKELREGIEAAFRTPLPASRAR